jgi:hypothetical protein
MLMCIMVHVSEAGLRTAQVKYVIAATPWKYVDGEMSRLTVTVSKMRHRCEAYTVISVMKQILDPQREM